MKQKTKPAGKLKCGAHWTFDPERVGKECYKCNNYYELRRKGLLQYSGTPWTVAISR